MSVERALLAAMSRDDEWFVDGYTATHVPSRISLWIANGFSFFAHAKYGEGPRPRLGGLFARWRLWCALQAMIDRRAVRALDAAAQ